MTSPYISLVGGQSPPVGKHWLIRLSNVLQSELESVETSRKHLWHIAQLCALNVVAENGFQFRPKGATYVLLLAESHLSIHTYPERQEAYIDLFTCNPEFQEEKLLNALRDTYPPDTTIDSFLILR